jgi:hypothetical protein
MREEKTGNKKPNVRRKYLTADEVHRVIEAAAKVGRVLLGRSGHRHAADSVLSGARQHQQHGDLHGDQRQSPRVYSGPVALHVASRLTHPLNDEGASVRVVEPIRQDFLVFG